MTDPTQLDITVARIDERTSNMYRDIVDVKTRLEKIDTRMCLQDDAVDALDIRVSNIEQFCKNNRTLIVIVGSVSTTIMLGVISYVLAHIGFPG